jgi:hypothetical protein
VKKKIKKDGELEHRSGNWGRIRQRAGSTVLQCLVWGKLEMKNKNKNLYLIRYLVMLQLSWTIDQKIKKIKK